MVINGKGSRNLGQSKIGNEMNINQIRFSLDCLCFLLLPYNWDDSEKNWDYYLVGGLEHLLFFHILGIITPTDELIFFQRGRSSTNQLWILHRLLTGVNCQVMCLWLDSEKPIS